jgi:peptidoglycan/LPS O-acetylase OafA/YrhL
MKVYFKNLDGIRFIAAVMVILQHTSDYMMGAARQLPNTFQYRFAGLGGYGVTLFFVLSGYLIFYLLFTEHKVTNNVSVKKFYIRRILRIWPLYIGYGLILIFGIDYAMARLGTPVNTPEAENLFYLFTFSINLQMLFALPNKGIIELYWSLCIEEQFYLIAPWLVKKWANKMLYIIITLIGIGLLSKIVFHYLEHSGMVRINKHNPLYFFTLCRLDDFGVGALAAFIYFKKSMYAKVEKIVTNKIVQLCVILLAAAIVLRFISLPGVIDTYLSSTVPAILFAFIILSASTGTFIVSLENKFLKQLGKYSYGIYVFHAVVAQLVLIVFLKYLPSPTSLNYDILYPLASIACTSLVACISYEIYEKQFLKLKDRFAIVKRGDAK